MININKVKYRSIIYVKYMSFFETSFSCHASLTQVMFAGNIFVTNSTTNSTRFRSPFSVRKCRVPKGHY